MSLTETFKDAIHAYRDVEVAKRNQPRLVQGVQQVSTPLPSNPGASNTLANHQAGISLPGVAGGYKSVIVVGLGALGLLGVVRALMKK